jgi:hypothetical protein
MSTPADLKLEQGKTPFGSSSHQSHAQDYGRGVSMVGSTNEEQVFSAGHTHNMLDLPQPQGAGNTKSIHRGESPLNVNCNSTEQQQQQQQQQQQLMSPGANGQPEQAQLHSSNNSNNNGISSNGNLGEENNAYRDDSQQQQQQQQAEHQNDPTSPRAAAAAAAAAATAVDPEGLFKHVITSCLSSSLLTSSASTDVRSGAGSVSSGYGGSATGASSAGYSELLNRYRLEQISKHLHGFQDPRIGISFAGGGAGGGASHNNQ